MSQLTYIYKKLEELKRDSLWLPNSILSELAMMAVVDGSATRISVL